MFKKLMGIVTSGKERSILTKQASLWMTSSLRGIDTKALMHDIHKFSVALSYFHGGALTLGRQLQLNDGLVFAAYMFAVRDVFVIEDFSLYQKLHSLVKSLSNSTKYSKYYYIGSSNIGAWVEVMATIPIDTQMPNSHPGYDTSLSRVLDDL